MGRRAEKPRSVRHILSVTSLLAIGAVLGVFVFGMVYYNWIVLENQRLVENVNRANDLSISVKEDIDQAAYNLVSGRTPPGSGETEALYGRIGAVLDRLEQNSSFEENRYLIEVARRTLQTVENYTDRIQENLLSGVPVAESEAILEDVHQVSELLHDVVLEFTAYEIRRAQRRTLQLQQTTAWMNVAQVGVCAAAIGLLLAQSRTFQRRISKPLGKMREMAARVAAGDFTARLEPTPVEELNGLVDSMNQMSGQIGTLLEANIEKQKTLRRAEAQILQAQITPHFLYNTLDTIVALAECGQLDEVVTTTIALSSFHRISLSGGHDWIPVSQEMAQIESYLTIQKIRYGTLLEYDLDIDEGILGEYMLKILLQPLVENAIYHGIKNSRRGGEIHVAGRREGDRLVFSVRNTGPGLEPEALERLRKSLKAEEGHPAHLDGKGYGLFNVNQRVLLFYEVSDGLSIESDPREGTTVTLRLPLHREGERQAWKGPEKESV